MADASGYDTVTLYRCFTTGVGFAVAIAEWKWGGFFKENSRRRPDDHFEGRMAADKSSCLESFPEACRKERALLRFSQFLNISIRAGEMDAEADGARHGVFPHDL